MLAKGTGGVRGPPGRTCEDHIDVRPMLVGPSRQAEAIHRARHLDIGEHHVDSNRGIFQYRDGLLGVGSFIHFVPALAQVPGNDQSDQDFIVDDEDAPGKSVPTRGLGALIGIHGKSRHTGRYDNALRMTWITRPTSYGFCTYATTFSGKSTFGR